MLDTNAFLVITPNHYLLLSAILFMIGVTGVLLRRNLIVLFMSIELMLNAVNISFVTFSHASGKVDGQVMVFFVMTIAAVEVTIGLAIAVLIFKEKDTVDTKEMTTLRG